MKKIDRIRFENLASHDESIRQKAAEQLESLERGYFKDESFAKFEFSPDQLDTLVNGWQHSPSILVRTWIAQALAITETDSDVALSLLAGALSLECQYIAHIAELLRNRIDRIPDGIALFKSQVRNPNDAVRWRCAMVMHSLVYSGEFVRELDMPILHTLMRDPYDGHTRMEAVRALDTLLDGGALGISDYEVLLDVVNIDDGSARYYAKTLMAKLEATIPGCTPTNFAPRIPRLRTDGIYFRNLDELSPDGIWIRSVCFRFLDDGSVHFFGTDEDPVDFPSRLPGRYRCDAKGVVSKSCAKITFSLDLANGTVDFTGNMDGNTISLTSARRASGASVQENYKWIRIDWSRTTTISDADDTRNAMPFVPVRKKSLRAADAEKWYTQMLARLPGPTHQNSL